MQGQKWNTEPISPIILSAENFHDEESNEILSAAIYASSSGQFPATVSLGVVTLNDLAGLKAWFAMGGYAAWARQHLTRQMTQLLDNYALANSSAENVFHLIYKGTQIKLKLAQLFALAKSQRGQERNMTRANFDAVNVEKANNLVNIKKAYALAIGEISEKQKKKNVAFKSNDLFNRANEARKKAMRRLRDPKGTTAAQRKNEGGTIRFADFGGGRGARISRQDWMIEHLVGRTEEFKNDKDEVRLIFIPEVVTVKPPKTKRQTVSEVLSKKGGVSAFMERASRDLGQIADED